MRFWTLGAIKHLREKSVTFFLLFLLSPFPLRRLSLPIRYALLARGCDGEYEGEVLCALHFVLFPLRQLAPPVRNAFANPARDLELELALFLFCPFTFTTAGDFSSSCYSGVWERLRI